MGTDEELPECPHEPPNPRGYFGKGACGLGHVAAPDLEQIYSSTRKALSALVSDMSEQDLARPSGPPSSYSPSR